MLNHRIGQQIGGRQAGSRLRILPDRAGLRELEEEALLAFKPDVDQIIPNLRDPEGAYMAFAAVAIAYAYNTTLARRGRAETGNRLRQAHLQGKLISVYPHDDDAALYLFHLIVQKYG